MRRIHLGFAARCVAVLCAAGASSASAALGAVDEWSSIGPPGGEVHALAIDHLTPTTVYAATFGGVLKSTNGGATWTTTNAGLTNTSVLRVVIDPQTPATLYVGAVSSPAVFKSVDGGATWTPKTAGLGGGSVRAIAIDPTNSNVLYARGAVGVVKSTNGGDLWSPSNNGIPFELNTIAIAVDPQSPSTVYTALRNIGVYKSIDAGASWIASNSGLTDFEIDAFALDPLAPSTLYVGTCGVSPDRGIFKSVDGGATWTTSSAGLDPNRCVDTVAVDPTAAGVVYASTTDGGTFKSGDGGATWTTRNVGIGGRRVLDFAVDPTSSATVYAASLGGGVFKTTDGATTWAPANDGVHAYSISALAFDPTAPSTLYVGTYSDDTSETVLRSTDGGVTWTPRGPLPADPYLVEFGVYSVAIDPRHPLTMYAGSDSGVFTTTDGGATWTDPPSSEFIHAVLIDPSDTSVVYAASDDSGVIKSKDHGVSWTAMNTGLPEPSVSALVLDPAHPKVLYVGTASGVYRTSNGGGSWTPRTTGMGPLPILALAIDPADGNSVYAAVSASPFHVFKTTDAGASWTDVSGPANVVALAVDPLRPSNVYAATPSGVSKSRDGGASWSGIDVGLTDRTVDTLGVNPLQPARVYTGTRGASVFVAQTRCLADPDCDDGDLCTTDVCAPDDPSADARGCVMQPVRCNDGCHEQAGFCDSDTGLCVYGSPALPDGTPCDDDDACTFDRCISGVCSGNPVPQVGCRQAQGRRFQIKHASNDAKDFLAWKWLQGSPTLVADLSDPAQGSARYTLCVYDHSGPANGPRLILRAATRSGLCAASPCWSAIGNGFKYRDRETGGDGIAKILLKAGITNEAKITLKAKGVHLALPSLPLTPSVIVQLTKTHGTTADRCWESTHATAIFRNDAQQFKAK